MKNHPYQQATPQLVAEYWKKQEALKEKLAKAQAKKSVLSKKLYAADCDILTYQEILHEAPRVILISEGLPIAIYAWDDASPTSDHGHFYIAGWDEYYRARFYRNVRDAGMWGLGFHSPNPGGGPSYEHHQGHMFPSFEIIQQMSVEWLVRNFQRENRITPIARYV